MSVGTHRPKRPRVSAGLLMYRLSRVELEVFIAHPGGPWFSHRDYDVWTIPKGEIEPGEETFAAAVREFEEEVGIRPCGPFIELGSILQKGGKTVHAWAFEGNWNEVGPPRSNLFSLEWPPGSGNWRDFPEVDRAGFFSLNGAKERLKLTQQPLLDRLVEAIGTLAGQNSR